MKTLIGVPCMDQVSTSFMNALVGLEPVGEVELFIVTSSLIYDARNEICKKAVDGGYDRILWLDSDMVFPSNLLERLSKRMDEGYDFVSGLYFTRKKPILPTIFNEIKMEEDEENHKKVAKIRAYMDYPRDSIFEIEACGFGCVMMKTSLAEGVTKNFGLPFSPVLGFGEDISFCMRATKLGKKLYCDSGIKLGHVGYTVITETTYREAMESEDGE
mgnify:CR=1 FL=1